MPQFQTIDWYDTPEYYDIVFDADTDRECAFLCAAIDKHCQTSPRSQKAGKRGIEPACGSGRLMAAMEKRGMPVDGFDLSAHMVAYANARLKRDKLKSRAKVGMMQSFSVARQRDFAFNLVSTFKYLLTEKDAKSHLQSIAAALKPGGIYILGFHLSEYDDTAKSRERWVAKRGKTQVTCNIQGWPPDAATRTERVRSRLMIDKNGSELRSETNWLFRTYDENEFPRLLKKVPMLKHIATYDFTYDIKKPIAFGEDQLDNIVILQKK